MTNYLKRVNGEPLQWLLELDEREPGVRYFALHWLQGKREDDPEVAEARAAIDRSGAAVRILEQQAADGHWGSENSLYRPGWAGTGAQLAILADVGADPADPRIQRACDWALAHGQASNGAISDNGRPSGAIHCVNGDMTRAFITFGRLDAPEVRAALSWTCNAILGRGDPEYRKSGTTGPGFACAHNGALPCAWGAVKELRALAAIPPRRRTAVIREAIDAGVEFLLSHDLEAADFPSEDRTSARWFKFGFPSNYQADLLELLLALTELGRLPDPRTAGALEVVLNHQDEDGRWPMESTLNGRMVTRIESQKRPSKWVTLRALRVLSAASGRR